MIGAAVSMFARIFARFPKEKFVCATFPSLLVDTVPAIPLACPREDKKWPFAPLPVLALLEDVDADNNVAEEEEAEEADASTSPMY
jgi:hypothetical protein